MGSRRKKVNVGTGFDWKETYDDDDVLYFVD